MAVNIVGLLKSAVQKGVSDIHLKINESPAVRKDGKIIRTQLPPLSEEDFFEILERSIQSCVKTYISYLKKCKKRTIFWIV